MTARQRLALPCSMPRLRGSCCSNTTGEIRNSHSLCLTCSWYTSLISSLPTAAVRRCSTHCPRPQGRLPGCAWTAAVQTALFGNAPLNVLLPRLHVGRWKGCVSGWTSSAASTCPARWLFHHIPLTPTAFFPCACMCMQAAGRGVRVAGHPRPLERALRTRLFFTSH